MGFQPYRSQIEDLKKELVLMQGRLKSRSEVPQILEFIAHSG